ncbi:MAG TPA: response regulator transcription factor [Gallionella sp.]|nr:response regulator transcription factor [Gallionella sp.]
MARIILVEDNIGQQEELLSFLTHAGHEVLGTCDGVTLDRCLQEFTPEIALLDYNLPGEAGIALAVRLRQRFGATIGLVMVTARSMGVDRVECRRAGADDYLVKPIDFAELLALIDNLMLRLNPPAPIEEAWQLLLTRSELVPPHDPVIPLTGWELLLLQTLADAPNRQASRDALIRGLGKNPLAYDPRALEANISRLRRKLPSLEDGRNPLLALRGIGYQFIRPLAIIN